MVILLLPSKVIEIQSKYILYLSGHATQAIQYFTGISPAKKRLKEVVTKSSLKIQLESVSVAHSARIVVKGKGLIQDSLRNERLKRQFPLGNRQFG